MSATSEQIAELRDEITILHDTMQRQISELAELIGAQRRIVRRADGTTSFEWCAAPVPQSLRA